MTKQITEYEIDKQKKKQELVRNEFLYHNMSAGKYEFPIIKKQNIDVNKIKFLSFVDAKKDDNENKNKTIHFFTYDWKFEKVYQNADEELEQKANINGKLLKNIWQDVKNPDFMHG